MVEFDVLYYSAFDSSYFSIDPAIKTSFDPPFALNFLSSILVIRKARYGQVVIQLYSLRSWRVNFIEIFENTVALL